MFRAVVVLLAAAAAAASAVQQPAKNNLAVYDSCECTAFHPLQALMTCGQ
jgi:hypothetical protein